MGKREKRKGSRRGNEAERLGTRLLTSAATKGRIWPDIQIDAQKRLWVE
jgi:hypothetical protein